ncbi:MAG: Gfo/Idh/MocA family protein [Kiritimatiellia bacterium]
MTQAPQTPLTRLIPRDHSPVRVAVAGLGLMGEVHMRAAAFLQAGVSEDYYKVDIPQQIKRLKICAVCDRDPARQTEFPTYPFYENWGDLIRNEKPHLAIIASPARTHVPLAMQALEAGVHTLVEKPVCRTVEECQTLINCAKRNGCRVQAGHVERYNPVAIKLHAVLTQEQLSIKSYRFERSQPLPERIPDDIITDKLIHDLDLAIYFFGPVTRTEILQCREVEGRVVEIEVKVQHEAGACGSLFVSWLVSDHAGRHRRVHMLTGGGEKISGDFLGKTLSIAGVEVTCGVQGWISPVNNQIKDQLADFLAYCLEPVEGIPPPLLSSGEMLESIRVIEHIRSLISHV